MIQVFVIMNNLKGNCKHCGSSNIKKSQAYPSDYFCIDCKDGDKIQNLNKQSRSSGKHVQGLTVDENHNKKQVFFNLCCEIDEQGRKLDHYGKPIIPDSDLEFED
jgi:hypothetical protein